MSKAPRRRSARILQIHATPQIRCVSQSTEYDKYALFDADPGERIAVGCAPWEDTGKVCCKRAECSVCLMPMERPQMLVCGHALCTDCYTGVIVAADAAEQAYDWDLPQEALCPICRAPLRPITLRASPTVRRLMRLALALEMPNAWTQFRIPFKRRHEVVVGVSRNGYFSTTTVHVGDAYTELSQAQIEAVRPVVEQAIATGPWEQRDKETLAYTGPAIAVPGEIHEVAATLHPRAHSGTPDELALLSLCELVAPSRAAIYSILFEPAPGISVTIELHADDHHLYERSEYTIAGGGGSVLLESAVPTLLEAARAHLDKVTLARLTVGTAYIRYVGPPTPSFAALAAQIRRDAMRYGS